MGVVLLQILQWILRVILFLLLLMVVLVAIVLIVPIRYRAEWDFLEKKPGVQGKITWFFYLIYMKFCYDEEFRMQVRVCGFKVFDSTDGEKKPEKIKTKKKNKKTTQNEINTVNSENAVTEINAQDAGSEIQETNVESKILEANAESVKANSQVDELAAWEKEMEAEAKEEAELAKQATEKNKGNNKQEKVENIQNDSEDITSEKEKKSLSEKIEDVKSKIQGIIQKIKDIIAKIQDGKLKVEHYLELWNRKETQITFSRAKKKFGRMIKAVLPRKWKLTGEIGFSDPCTTGQFMGALGAMYPILGNKVQIVPNFENEVINIEGNVKGHIRLGNLLYQIVSLLLNRHCFKFIKLIFNELGSSKKNQKKQNV